MVDVAMRSCSLKKPTEEDTHRSKLPAATPDTTPRTQHALMQLASAPLFRTWNELMKLTSLSRFLRSTSPTASLVTLPDASPVTKDLKTTNAS